MALPFYMFGIAEQTITSSLAGLINGSTPILLPLLLLYFTIKSNKTASFVYFHRFYWGGAHFFK